MKQRLILVLLVCFLLMLSLCGCQEATPEALSSSESDMESLPPVPEIPEDYLYFATENVYLSYYTENSAYIDLISAFPLTGSDIELSVGSVDLKLDVDFKFGSNMNDQSEIVMPFYVYQIYRGKDWSALLELDQKVEASNPWSANEQEDTTVSNDDWQDDLASYDLLMDEVIQSQDEFLEDYLLLEKAGKLPVLYSYNLYINFPKDSSAVASETITLRAKGQELTCSLGQLHYETEVIMDYSDDALQGRGGYGYHTTWANADGRFYEYNGSEVFAPIANEDVTITKISLLNDDRSISDIQLTITEPLVETALQVEPTEETEEGEILEEPSDRQIVAKFFWDGSTPVELTEGQQVYIDFVFSDPNLKNVPYGYTQYYVDVEYLDAHGKVCHEYQWFPMIVELFGRDPHEIYLWYELGVDVLDYYTNYCYHTEGKYLLTGIFPE